MDKILILAYMGTGKTEVSKKYNDVVDFDFQDYKYIYDKSIAHLPLEQRKGNVSLRTENPNYPNNFLNDAIKLLNSNKIVISPFIEHVFNAYDSEFFKSKIHNVRTILIFPERNNFEEYEIRFKKRGNGEEFIQRRRIEFDSLANLFEQAKGYEKVVVNKGEYLEDILKSKNII